MANNTFYFSHDCDARNDEKMVKLRQKHDWYGSGVYWAIVEKLYGADGELEADYDCIAYDLRTESERIKSIVEDFSLFYLQDNKIRSNSVDYRLAKRQDRSIKASDSAKARWNKPKSNANALQTQSKGNAIKDSIVKDSIVKESKTTPVPQKCETEFLEFWKHYPKKVAKGSAKKAWLKHKPILSEVLTALKWQCRSADWKKDGGQYIQYPATYLNAGMWQDSEGSLGYVAKDYNKPTQAKSNALKKVEDNIAEAQDEAPMTLDDINDGRDKMGVKRMTQEEFDRL